MSINNPNILVDSHRLITGIKMVDTRPYLDDQEETRYVYGDSGMDWYFNNETEAIELRNNNKV